MGGGEDSDEDASEANQGTTHSMDNMDPKAVNALKKGPGLGQFMAVLATMQSTAEKVSIIILM